MKDFKEPKSNGWGWMQRSKVVYCTSRDELLAFGE